MNSGSNCDVASKIRDLIDQSIAVKARAYCPYSKFRVGAAVLTDTGVIISGNVTFLDY
jgi:cytidine deaminase